MREIKFRAWDKKRKEMCEVVCLNLRDTYPDHILLRKNGLDYNAPKEDLDIIEFTGLRDKNGVAIYEGDKFKDYTQSSRIYIVVWENLFSGFFAEPLFGIDRRKYGRIRIPFRHNIEVFGNIYENPNLLRGGSDEDKR